MANPKKIGGTIKVDELIKFFGGHAQLHRSLQAYNFKVPHVKTIHKWRDRNSIPTDRLADLAVLAHVSGMGGFDLYRFIEVSGPNE